MKPTLKNLTQVELLALLGDRNRAIANAARERLMCEHIVPRETIWAMLATATRAHTRAHLVALLSRGQRIESIIWLLNAFALGDIDVRRQACHYLQRWGDYRLPAPADQLARLRVALQRAKLWLPIALADQLEAYIAWAAFELRCAKRRQALLVARQPKATIPLATERFHRQAMLCVWNGKDPVLRTFPLNGRVIRQAYVLSPKRHWALRWLIGG